MATVVVKTIGTGGDYSTPQAWEDACPANLVSADQVWEGQLLNQVFSSSGTILNISGTTVDATRFVRLTTAPGASFLDHASAATNPLRYNESVGACLKTTGDYAIAVDANQDYTQISKVQIQSTSAGTSTSALRTGGSCDVDRCIIEGFCSSTAVPGVASLGLASTIRNSLVVYRGANVNQPIIYGEGAANIVNVTAVSLNTTVNVGITLEYSTTAVVKNCYVGGATTPRGGGATVTPVTCASQVAATGFAAVPLSTATFQSVADSTRDFRLASGSSLIDAGTNDATYSPYDILGRTKSGTTDIGAWESSGGGGGGDTTAPTLTGSITFASITTTSYTASWPAGSDNIAVTGYRYRINGGSWVDMGTTRTANITGRTAGSTDSWEIQAYDAAGNYSTALTGSVTLNSAAQGTISLPAVRDWSTGALKTGATYTADVYDRSTGSLVVRKTGLTTHASAATGSFADALIVAGTTYRVVTEFADGSLGVWNYTAS